MKRKTWMISALMYAMVFMACFGVLHFMKKLMEPAGPVQTEATTKGPGPASAGDDHRKRPEDGTEDSRAEKKRRGAPRWISGFPAFIFLMRRAGRF